MLPQDFSLTTGVIASHACHSADFTQLEADYIFPTSNDTNANTICFLRVSYGAKTPSFRWRKLFPHRLPLKHGILYGILSEVSLFIFSRGRAIPLTPTVFDTGYYSIRFTASKSKKQSTTMLRSPPPVYVPGKIIFCSSTVNVPIRTLRNPNMSSLVCIV